jgi:FkbH-like protein
MTDYMEQKLNIVLDLDNTLWGGTLGDDGYDNISIDNQTPQGKVFFDFQKIVLNLKKRGILLAICSKNFEKNVKQAFEKNPNLVLKYKDFVSVKANWNNKANNIQNISKELNIGLDSFIFLDDNPAERELVRTFLPNVTIPELPSDPSYYKDILLNNFYFDLISLSKEDVSRSKTYISNFKREKLKEKFNDFNSYLRSLKMVCEYSSFKKEDYDRIVQLFLRSNQFNFTTTRYSLKDIHNIISDKMRVTFQFSFKDKFSNYGIISLIIGTIKKNELFIDNWVMSCRVLNRTLENFILNSIVKYCKIKKIKKIVGIYIQTKKNSLVKKLYIDLGFLRINNPKNSLQFFYDIGTHKNKQTLVEEKK